MKKFIAGLPFVLIGAALMVAIGFVISKIRAKKEPTSPEKKGV